MKQSDWQKYDAGWIAAMSSNPPADEMRLNQAYMDGYYEAKESLMASVEEFEENPFLEEMS